MGAGQIRPAGWPDWALAQRQGRGPPLRRDRGRRCASAQSNPYMIGILLVLVSVLVYYWYWYWYWSWYIIGIAIDIGIGIQTLFDDIQTVFDGIRRYSDQQLVK